MNINKKRGQVTVFIIIGLLLLITITIFTIVSSNKVKRLGTEIEKSQKTTITIDPIQKNIETCAKDMAIKALRFIGTNGGYISLKENRYLNGRTINIDTTNSNPTDHDAFSFAGINNIPYWFYMDTENNCLDTSTPCEVTTKNIQSLEEIENNLNIYLDENIPLCINDFQAFGESGFTIEELSQLKVNTTIAENTVLVDIDYHIKISKNDETWDLDHFYKEIELDFKDIYMLALGITLHQKEMQSFEEIFLKLIDNFAFPLDRSRVPPTGHIDWKTTTVRWEKDKIPQRIMDFIIASNMPYIKINGTRDSLPFIVNPANINEIRDIQDKIKLGELDYNSADPNLRDLVIKQGIYDSLVLNIMDFLYFPTTTVTFIYDPSWPIYFHITPASGNVLKPSVHKETLPYGGGTHQENKYEFFYDISVPILVIINARSAIKTEDSTEEYTFMFGLEANIRNNKNLLQWHLGEGTINWDYNFAQSNMNPNMNQNPDITTSEVFIPEKTLLCDESMWISGDITIRTYDSVTRSPLDKVILTYGCGTYAACPLDVTTSDGTHSSKITKLPICIGEGYLMLEKTGYEQKIVSPITTRLDEDQIFDIYLEPARKINVTSKRIDIARLKILFDSRDNMINQSKNLSNFIESIKDKLEPENQTKADQYVNDLFDIKESINETIIWSETTPNEIFSKIDDIKTIVDLTLELDKDYCSEHIPTGAFPDWFYYQNCINKFRNSINPLKFALDIIKNDLSFLNTPELSSTDLVSTFRSWSKDLVINEEVILDIQKVKQIRFESEFTEEAELTELNLKEEIGIIPGEFNIQLTYLDYGGVFIPKESSRTCEQCKSFGTCESKCKELCESNTEHDIYKNYICGYTGVSNTPIRCGACSIDFAMPKEDIDINPAPLGGAGLTEESGYWQLDKDELDSSILITFYFLRGENANLITEMDGLSDFSDYPRYRQFIEPELS